MNRNMNNRMKKNMNNNLRNKFLVSTSLCIVGFLGIVCASYYTKDDNEKHLELKKVEKVTKEQKIEEDSMNEKFVEVGDVIPNSQEEETSGVDVWNNPETVPYREKTEENPVEGDGSLNGMSTEVNAAINTLEFDKKSTLLWPVEGNIILEYNMDNTIYFPTLNEYKTNPAIVIQSEEFAPVRAAAKGVVTEVSDNEELGVYIKMAVGNDYEITYGQIVNPTVEEGQVVEAGKVIACVNTPTRYYEKEGYNLNFKLTKKGKPVDPMKYLTVTE